jgi:predicted dehydrogenase
MSIVGVGVVGYGYWGPNLVRNFFEVQDARVAAISDRCRRRLDTGARRYPSVKTTTDFRELLRDPAVDAVVIATPVDTHYELASAALRAGKHVLVEKPMTETSEQAKRLIDEAGRRQLVLMVDHTFVYTPAVQKIRELVASGVLGDIYYYDSVRINLGLFKHDVNVIWDLAVHDLSILDSVLGDFPLAVSANGACHVQGHPENMAHIALFFDNNVIAHINVNWLAPVKIRRTLVGGSAKMILFDDLEPSEKVKVYDKGVTINADPETIYQMMVGYRVGDMWAPQLATKEALLTEAEHFVACIETGATPITDGMAGLRVVEMLEATTQSLKLRGHPIDLRPLRRVS